MVSALYSAVGYVSKLAVDSPADSNLDSVVGILLDYVVGSV